MERKFIILVFLIIAMLGVSGCGKTNPGDSYVEGSDYQYMFEGSWIFYQKSARGTNGYFFVNGHYIYYLDDNTQKLVPLCNKADCLHNRETDEKRYIECNAHIENEVYVGNVGISYCNGYLYYIEIGTDEDGWCQDLYRMKEDGSQKQSIYHWDNWTTEEWCIHRDTLYYVEHTYETVEVEQDEPETIEKYAVKKLALTGGGKKKPETIYEVEEGITVYSLSRVQAYGNHVYFTLDAATVSDTNVLTDENYLDYTCFDIITYDLDTSECKPLTLPNEKKGVYIQLVTFWNDKLILGVYDSLQKMDGVSNSYLSDLDGSNVEVFQKDIIQGEIYLSDGKYLYISNSPLVEGGYEDKQYYRVYDQEMNLVDTLKTPFIGNPEIGMEKGQYLFKTNKDKTGADLMFFDKSTIGTFQGSSAKDSYVKIAEIEFSPEDLAEIRSMEESE